MTNVIRYQFKLNESTNELFGLVETVVSHNDTADGQAKVDFSAENLKERACTEGFGDFDFVPGGLGDLHKLLANKENGQVKLADRRDATLTISIANDKNSVTATTTAAMGGKPLTTEIIVAALEKNQIDKRTFDEAHIKALVAATSDQEVVIAQSLPVKNGENTRFVSLVEGKANRERDLTAITAVNHKELFDFEVIDVGTPVMRKEPATAGTAGLNVFGKEIKPKAGKNTPFRTPFTGVEISTAEENTLISTIKGLPTIGHNAVRVDPILVVDSVDAKTGNIEFDGMLVVNKNIESGFIVDVTGDVLVKGAINKAIVNVTGNLVVAGGIQAEILDNDNINNLHVSGDLTTKFLNQCNIQCLGNIFVDEYILHCEITCKGTVNVGQEKGKGCIIGGSCKSQKGVSCKTIGSNAYIATILVIASGRDIKKELEIEDKNLERRKREQEQLSQMSVKLNTLLEKDASNQELAMKASKINNTITMLNETIGNIEQTIVELNVQLNELATIELRVSQNIFPNVTVTINDSTWACEDQLNKTLIKEESGSIVLGSF